MSNDRESLAAVSARIIVESELTDWALARRKAMAELGLAAHGTPLPTDEQIISEIKVYHALYGRDDWAAQLRAQREFALEAMLELEAFRPVLVGPVAEGWAHAGSEIRIEASPENPKTLEYRLIDLGVEFEPHLSRDGNVQLEIVDGDWPMRIVIRTPGRAPEARYRVRLDSTQLKALIAKA